MRRKEKETFRDRDRVEIENKVLFTKRENVCIAYRNYTNFVTFSVEFWLNKFLYIFLTYQGYTWYRADLLTSLLSINFLPHHLCPAKRLLNTIGTFVHIYEYDKSLMSMERLLDVSIRRSRDIHTLVSFILRSKHSLSSQY